MFFYLIKLRLQIIVCILKKYIFVSISWGKKAVSGSELGKSCRFSRCRNMEHFVRHVFSFLDTITT